MTTLPTNQKLATGTYTAGVTLTSAQNNPFTFLGKINAFPPGLGYQGGNPGLVLVAADISTLAAVPWSVTNQGSIVGSRFGVTFAGAGTLTNTGVVNGQYGNGVAFAQYGKLVNSGTVKGQYAAFFPNGGIITNTATIAGDQSGIRSVGVLNINNAAGASITAVINVVSSYGGVSIVNAGTIKATGSTSSSNYTNRYVAIQSPGGTGAGKGGGSVTNLAGGLITSTNSGILLSGGAGTVANAGTIGGGTFSGNYAVSMAAGFNNRLVLSQGAVFNGKVNGGGPTSVLELTSSATAGTISGVGSKYLNFGTIALDNLATWTLSGPVASATKVAFVPGGAGTVILATPAAMAGTITGFGDADFIQLPGILTNATGGTLGAGNTLSIPQTNGQTLTLNFDLTQSLTPVVIAQSDGSSYVYDYNPAAAPSNEIATHFSGANGTGTVLTKTISNTSGVNNEFHYVNGGTFTGIGFGALIGTSLHFFFNPTSAVKLQVTQYGSPRAAGTKVSDVLNNIDGTTLIYAYNPTSTVKLTAQNWSATTPGTGAPAGTKTSAVVDNNDGTALIYQYNPSSTVTLNVTKYSATDPANGAPTGTLISNVVNNINGTSIVYAYNPTSTVTQTATFFPGTNTATGAPTGTATAVTFDYVLGFTYASQPVGSSITTYGANGQSTTQYYNGPDGTRGAVGAPIVSGAAFATQTFTSSALVADAGTITIAGSGQTIDLGTGNRSIQFAAGATADTLVLDPGGLYTITGFDPSAGDLLDVRSLFAAANVHVDAASFLISNYISVTAVAGSAAISFDPSGKGGGSQVALLQNDGGLVNQLQTMRNFVV